MKRRAIAAVAVLALAACSEEAPPPQEEARTAPPPAPAAAERSAASVNGQRIINADSEPGTAESAQSCQECHMPGTFKNPDGSEEPLNFWIANIQDDTYPESDFSLQDELVQSIALSLPGSEPPCWIEVRVFKMEVS